MKTHRLTIEDIQVNVSICGQGSPLLLLNGLGGLIRTFDALRDGLADYTTITLDVPGVGDSQMPHWPMRLPRHADLIAEMLKQLGFDQVDVFGVSWGGARARIRPALPEHGTPFDPRGYVSRPSRAGKACRHP